MRAITVLSLMFLSLIASPVFSANSDSEISSKSSAKSIRHSHNGRVHSHILPNTGLKHFHRHEHNGRSHIHPYSADIGFKHTHNNTPKKIDSKSVKHQHGNRWHSHPLPSSGLNHPHKHKHGGRTHSHPLPATGINHYHHVNPQKNTLTSIFMDSILEPETTPFNQNMNEHSMSAAQKVDTKTPELNIKDIVKQLSLSKKISSDTKRSKIKNRVKTKPKVKPKPSIKQSIKRTVSSKKSVMKKLATVKPKIQPEPELEIEAQPIQTNQSIESLIESPIQIPTEEQQLSTTRQFEIGLRYENGKGVEKNLKQAAKWYRRAAEQGHTKAQYNLASLYENGQGVKKNLQQAMKWYKKAAEQSKVHVKFQSKVQTDKNSDN